MKTIVLTGMMGSGKTTIGKLLSQSYGCKFTDLDNEIEKHENSSVFDIFKTNGEQYFRALEKEILFNIFTPENHIIALGGGTFENAGARKFLLKNAVVIYLDASVRTILDRLKDDYSRPLIAGKKNAETISSVIRERQQNYEKAQHKIVTDGKSPEDIVKEIAGVLKND